MKKILIVFGTRPEAIKMAPVVLEFKKYPELFDLKVCVTAQHREMLDQVLKIFEIKPDFDLNIMQPNQDLYQITSSILFGLKAVFELFLPDLILVHGDTTTTLSGSLAAFYQKIPVGHVEAGLRTFNHYSPWPEEINRQITDRICTYLFPPTQKSKEYLINEGIQEKNICVTGNTVIDALIFVKSRISSNPVHSENLRQIISDNGFPIKVIENNLIRPFILVTGHRRESFGEGFINICKALKELALRYPQFDIVYPVHLNPNVQKPVNEILGNLKNIYLIKPLDYEPFVYLMDQSYLIVTDSGGIQEEAPTLGKPVVVMRENTERPEAVEAGTVVLVGTDKDKIVKTISSLIENQKKYFNMSKAHNPYGDGFSSKRIVEFFKKNYYGNHV